MIEERRGDLGRERRSATHAFQISSPEMGEGRVGRSFKKDKVQKSYVVG